MNLPRIGRGISTAASNCIGTTTHALLTFRCRDISKTSSKNTSIKCPPNHNIACTRLHQNNTGPKHKPCSQSTSPPIIRWRNKGNSTNRREHFVLRTSGRYHGPHGPQLNRKQTNTRHHEHDGKDLCWITLPHTRTRPFGSERWTWSIHSDTSYLSETKAHSHACGYFFMGWSPKDGDPIKLNGAFFTLCTILRFVVASVAEAELSALFLNCKEGIIFRLILEELGHCQPRTPVHCNNATTVSIANNTVKGQWSWSMEMRYFWVGDKEAQDIYKIKWHPGHKNLADYQSKHQIGSHHLAVCPWYLHKINSPLVLPRAMRPSTLKGCVGNLPEGYIHNVPLPRVPRDQSTFQSRVQPVHTLPVYYEETHIIPTYNSTCRLGERVA